MIDETLKTLILGILFILYVIFGFGWVFFSSTSYEIVDDVLILRKRIYGIIPAQRLKIRISDIQEIRHARWWQAYFSYYVASRNSNAVLIVFKQRRLPFLIKKVFFTPHNTEKFIKRINRLLARQKGVE